MESNPWNQPFSALMSKPSPNITFHEHFLLVSRSEDSPNIDGLKHFARFQKMKFRFSQGGVVSAERPPLRLVQPHLHSQVSRAPEDLLRADERPLGPSEDVLGPPRRGLSLFEIRAEIQIQISVRGVLRAVGRGEKGVVGVPDS